MTAPELKFNINLLSDDNNSVVTGDGEYLGTWDTDDSDAFYEFTPDGSDEVMFSDPFMGNLCKQILKWHDPEAEGLLKDYS